MNYIWENIMNKTNNDPKTGSSSSVAQSLKVATLSASSFFASAGMANSAAEVSSDNQQAANVLDSSASPELAEIQGIRNSYDLMRASQVGSFMLHSDELSGMQSELRRELQAFVGFVEEVRMMDYSASPVMAEAQNLIERQDRFLASVRGVQGLLDEAVSTMDFIETGSQRLAQGLSACNEMAGELRAGVFDNFLTEEMVAASERMESRYREYAIGISEGERKDLIEQYKYELLIESAGNTMERFGVDKVAYIGSVVLAANIPEAEQDRLLNSFLETKGDDVSLKENSEGIARELVACFRKNKADDHLSTEAAIDLTLVQSRDVMIGIAAAAGGPLGSPDGNFLRNLPYSEHGPKPAPDDLKLSERMKETAKRVGKRLAVRAAVNTVVGKITGIKPGAIGLFLPAPALNDYVGPATFCYNAPDICSETEAALQEQRASGGDGPGGPFGRSDIGRGGRMVEGSTGPVNSGGDRGGSGTSDRSSGGGADRSSRGGDGPDGPFGRSEIGRGGRMVEK